MARFRPRHFKPTAALELGLSDPISGLNMGQTAEVLARDFAISRDAQDRFALQSHQRAEAAWRDGRMKDEVVPVPIPPSGNAARVNVDGIGAAVVRRN